MKHKKHSKKNGLACKCINDRAEERVRETKAKKTRGRQNIINDQTIRRNALYRGRDSDLEKERLQRIEDRNCIGVKMSGMWPSTWLRSKIHKCVGCGIW
jgi:hypothetical protein